MQLKSFLEISLNGVVHFQLNSKSIISVPFIRVLFPNFMNFFSRKVKHCWLVSHQIKITILQKQSAGWVLLKSFCQRPETLLKRDYSTGVLL